MELMRHFWDAAVALDPAVADLDEGVRFPICRPDRLASLWHDAGLSDVTVRAIDVPTVFLVFDDYWTPFLGGQGRARLRHVARRASARPASRPDSSTPADRTRRADQSRRPRLGGTRPVSNNDEPNKGRR